MRFLPVLTLWRNKKACRQRPVGLWRRVLLFLLCGQAASPAREAAVPKRFPVGRHGFGCARGTFQIVRKSVRDFGWLRFKNSAVSSVGRALKAFAAYLSRSCRKNARGVLGRLRLKSNTLSSADLAEKQMRRAGSVAYKKLPPRNRTGECLQIQLSFGQRSSRFLPRTSIRCGTFLLASDRMPPVATFLPLADALFTQTYRYRSL